MKNEEEFENEDIDDDQQPGYDAFTDAFDLLDQLESELSNLLDETESVMSEIRIPNNAYTDEDEAGEFIGSFDRAEIRYKLDAIKNYLDRAFETLDEMDECVNFD